jgi:hypothetical protein
MSLLQLLCEADGAADIGNFSSLLFLLQQHADEGFAITSPAVSSKLPSSRAAHGVTSGSLAQTVVAAVVGCPVPPQVSKSGSRPSPLQTEAVAAALSTGSADAATQQQRRIGGVAPPSPYTPFTQGRRLSSGGTTTGTTGSRPRPESASVATHGIAAPTTASAGGPSLPTSSEFVDRWLEKLYFRNPVVVRKHSASAQRSASATQQRAQQPTPSTVEDDIVVVAAGGLHNYFSNNENNAPVVDVVAHLPPKPTLVRPCSRADQIRHEVVQERLVNAFNAKDGHSATYGAAVVGNAHFSSSSGDAPAPVSSSVVGSSSLGCSRPPSPLAHGFCLPSSSKFVEKKKHAAQAMMARN